MDVARVDPKMQPVAVFRLQRTGTRGAGRLPRTSTLKAMPVAFHAARTSAQATRSSSSPRPGSRYDSSRPTSLGVHSGSRRRHGGRTARDTGLNERGGHREGSGVRGQGSGVRGQGL